MVATYGSCELNWEVEVGTARCDDRCREAVGMECVCSCGGVHHGEAHWGGDWEPTGRWLRRTVEEVQR